MIAHNTPDMYAYTVSVNRPAKNIQKNFLILVLRKNIVTTIPFGNNVIYRTVILNS